MRDLAPSPEVRGLAQQVRALVRDVIPDAVEEVDAQTEMYWFTFVPGAFRGMILAVAPQRTHVNVIFSRGTELMELDATGLLEGPGRTARHIKVSTTEQVKDPGLRALIEAAAARTPRA